MKIKKENLKNKKIIKSLFEVEKFLNCCVKSKKIICIVNNMKKLK